MKMTGNETGEVVRSWEDLSNIPTDKLIKLRDVIKDHLKESYDEYMDARNKAIAIQTELSSRD